MVRLSIVREFMRTEIFRFGCASVASLCADVIVLVILKEKLDWSPLVAAPLGFLLGSIVHYLISITWVFKYRHFTDWRLELATFILIGIVGLGINQLVMWLCIDKYALHYLVAKGMAVLITFVWNFSGKKLVLFSERKQRASAAANGDSTGG